jgi:hypothetical protein
MTRFGLRAKLTATISLLIVALATFFALYLPAQQERAADDALRAHAATLANVLADMAGPSVAVAGEMGPDAVIADLRTWGQASDEIAYIAVVKPDGNVFARFVAEGVTQDIPQLTPTRQPLTTRTSDHIHQRVPLVGDEGFIGTLALGISRAAVLEARAESQKSALWVSGAIFLVGLLVAWLVGSSISRPLLGAANQLDSVSKTLVSAAREQEASCAQEAAVVAETRRSMDMLLDAAQQIAARSSEVLGNAERSATGSQHIADRIGDLNAQAEKVAEILAAIMQVADKADLLALNASLEGTRAGEAGKGFGLVAAEMRRLAENVMESVASIRALMKDMREASHAAVEASQVGLDSSKATAGSARSIALVTQEQRQATEQVIASMDEMNDVLNHTVVGVQRSTRSARDLATLADTLSSLVNPAVHNGRRSSLPGDGSGANGGALNAGRSEDAGSAAEHRAEA